MLSRSTPSGGSESKGTTGSIRGGRRMCCEARGKFPGGDISSVAARTEDPLSLLLHWVLHSRQGDGRDTGTRNSAGKS